MITRMAQILLLLSLYFGLNLCLSSELLAQRSGRKVALSTEEKQHKLLLRHMNSRHDQFHFGSHLGLGIPHPVDVGVSLTRIKNQSHIVSGGYYTFKLPKGKFRTLKADISHLEYKFRSMPSLRHPVFWGVGVGIHRIQFAGMRPIFLEHQDSGTNLSVDVYGTMDVLAAYYTPHLGMVWYQKNGLHAGFSFGYIIPFWSKAAMDTVITGDQLVDNSIKSTASYRDLQSSMEKLGTRVGKLGLPYLQLFEIGYLF